MALAANFFTKEEQSLLIDAITEAETSTSGEIRLHLENFCIGSEVEAAKKIFLKLGMQNTKEKNGVLIYIATVSHKIAIIGDEGIHQRLGSSYWEKLVNDLVTRFRANQKAQALADCIIDCGKQLGTYFPRQHDDQDELSNSISY